MLDFLRWFFEFTFDGFWRFFGVILLMTSITNLLRAFIPKIKINRCQKDKE